MTRQWYALDRLEDTGGLSGVGVVAWVLELSSGDMLMFWDTTVNGEPTHTVEWLPSRQRLLDIHGHQGRTVLRPVEWSNTLRGVELAAWVYDDLDSAVWEVNAELAEVGDDADPQAAQ